MYISLDAYRVFYYVARHRSFTKAAGDLYSNQPNVTRTIRNLERALGCALFIRNSRSVRLTPEGEELFNHIAPAMRQIQSGEETVLLHRSMERGTVRVGASEIALHRVLLPVLEQFRKAYPGIRLRIVNSNSRQAVSALKDSAVDFALLTLPIDIPVTFHRTDLDTFREIPVCASAYAFLAERTLTLEELSAHPLISLCPDSATHRLYSDWFGRHGLSFSPDIEAATADQILPMVRANLGIGFVEEHALQNAPQDGSIYTLRLSENPPERAVCLLKRKEYPLSAAARRLEEMLLDYSRHIAELAPKSRI